MERERQNAGGDDAGAERGQRYEYLPRRAGTEKAFRAPRKLRHDLRKYFDETDVDFGTDGKSRRDPLAVLYKHQLRFDRLIIRRKQ